MKRLSALLAATLFGASALAAVPAAAQIADGSFETQGAASMGTTGYCYFGGTYAAACASGAWTGNTPTSGLQGENNGAWPGVQTPAGSYYAFIQSGYGAQGSISQSITLATGLYSFSWLEAGRPGGGGDQAYTVTLGGQTLYTGGSTSGEAFTARSSAPVLITGGNYTLAFTGTNAAGMGDNAAFIDRVAVAAVPEPATWIVMVLGFGMIGAGLRSRRRAAASAALA